LAYKRVKEIGEIAEKLKNFYGRTLERASKEQIYQACALCLRDKIMDKWTESREAIGKKGQKVVIYMSAEFLMGRALVNNMINMGVYDAYAEALEESGIPIDEVEPVEDDAALGNGGLGRLAACFLDSMAALGIKGDGMGLRYKFGLFKQKIESGYQIEIPDAWLDEGYVWEHAKPYDSVMVRFGGKVERTLKDGVMEYKHVDYTTVRAVPYDVPILGFGGRTVNTLHLWDAQPVHDTIDMEEFNKGNYSMAIRPTAPARMG